MRKWNSHSGMSKNSRYWFSVKSCNNLSVSTCLWRSWHTYNCICTRTTSSRSAHVSSCLRIRNFEILRYVSSTDLPQLICLHLTLTHCAVPASCFKQLNIVTQNLCLRQYHCKVYWNTLHHILVRRALTTRDVLSFQLAVWTWHTYVASSHNTVKFCAHYEFRNLEIACRFCHGFILNQPVVAKKPGQVNIAENVDCCGDQYSVKEHAYSYTGEKHDVTDDVREKIAIRTGKNKIEKRNFNRAQNCSHEKRNYSVVCWWRC